MRVVGIDPSTKRIGFAFADGRTMSIAAHAGAEDPARRLYELRNMVTGYLVRYPPLPDLVALEGYALDSPGRLALVRLGELGGVLRCALFDLDVPFVQIPPTSLKRYATGRGNASKEQMEARARELGSACTNHDEADAWLLRRMALAANGIEPMDHDHERDAVANAGVVW